MLFHSNQYLLIFLPAVFFFYFFRYKNFYFPKILTLSFVSIIFYSAWNIYFLPLIIFIIFCNYSFHKLLLKSKKYLFLLISMNLLILIIFKYTDFIILNINLIFESNIEFIDLPFPLALSFVTFQVIAFLVDYYDRSIKKIEFNYFFLFIIFFPQLIAGPIVKYNDIVSQYKNKKNKKINITNIFVGLSLILIGFLKKILLADNLGTFADIGFYNVNEISTIESWISSFAFTFQIYFDFSGYVDMATGSALLFNIKLPQNFNSPFKAMSLINFWQRWHITLTNFLTNYIFNPCVRSLKKITFFKMMFLIIFVFILCGFWHGPSWMYGFFGLLHGIGLSINHIFNKFFKIKLHKFIAWFLTFNFVNLTFIFFRTQDFNDGLSIIFKMFNYNYFLIENSNTIQLTKSLILITFCFFLCLFFKNSYELFYKYLGNKNNINTPIK
jgi:alginate O-acetyltransferase complex protein AlgI